jgi:hypothetical protein
MANLTTVRRVTIVLEGTHEQRVINWITELGAKGYTQMECRGKGGHVLMDDFVSGGVSRVRIETIVQPDVAEKIIDRLEQYRELAMTFCVEDVQVTRPHKF